MVKMKKLKIDEAEAKRLERETNRKRLLSDRTKFAVKESYKELRTNVMFSLAGDESKVILVTSALAGEGKSTSCFNLAMTFAETGAKVIVLDCDLRRPNVGKLLGFNDEEGLSNYLVKKASLEKVVKSSGFTNLDVILAGKVPPNPVELLSSDSMKELLEILKEKYDYIFLDTPPIHIVTDAAAMSSLVDGTIVVVRQFVAEKNILKEAVGKLEFVNAKILGFVFNDVVVGGKNYGKYNSSYKYGYY